MAPLLLVLTGIGHRPGAPFYEAWVVAFVIFAAGHRYDTVRVWAECKDVKDGITRAHVAILKHNVDDVRARKLGWKPTHVYMVTGNRFEQNALKLACSYGFECFERAWLR